MADNKKITRVAIGFAGASMLIIGLAACSSAEPTATQASESPASNSPTPASQLDTDGDGTLDAHDYAPTDPDVQRAEDVKAPAPASAPVPSSPAPAAPAPPSSTVVVPDVTGMNYQDAQDALRASGLSVFPATDGLGADRFAVVDLNWYVVSQDTLPGTTVDAGTGITCTILKYTDK